MLDEEVDTAPPPEQALLPKVLSFLSSFPQYLDIVVQCTRKTEVRSWRTLFSNLPPAQELFEESLQRGSLKTAGGYLLVLHTFEELNSVSNQVVRLLQRARAEQDWDLCKELARFLMALDESGATLRKTLELVELGGPLVAEDATTPFALAGTARLGIPSRGRNSSSKGTTAGVGLVDVAFGAHGRRGRVSGSENGSKADGGSSRSPTSMGSQPDYFGAATAGDRQ